MNSGIAILIISILWVGSEIVLARMKHSQAADRHCDKSSLRVLWTTIVVAISGGIVASTLRMGFFSNVSLIPALVGLVLILCGLLVRWIAIFSLKRQFTVDVAITENPRIIKSGLYRFVRHPAYTGSLLSFLGLSFCFSNYLSMIIIFVPILLAFLYRIEVEEEALIGAFGKEYLDYCASTRRLIPGIY